MVTARPLTMLSRPEGFAQALRQAALAHTEHFALHRLRLERPQARDEPVAGPSKPLRPKLSTSVEQHRPQAVDNLVGDSPCTAPAKIPGSILLGLVIPQRHAKRAVTRNLIRREAKRMAVQALGDQTAVSGAWVVRLCRPFDTACHPSAASNALRSVVREQLQALFAKGLRR